jgi:hypothetical protein
MRTRTFALLGLVVAMGLVHAAQGPEFKLYASTEGRFKVLMPGAVKSETVEVEAGKDKLTLTIDSVELRAGTMFLVTFIDATEEAAKQPAAARIDKVRDGNKGADGKVLEEKELTIGAEKHPARDVLIEKPSGFLRNRIVIVGRRLYQAMVMGSKEVVTSPSADKFLASFEVTK